VFVSLGLGSVVAASIEAAPWLIPIGRHKTAIFLAVGILLGVNYWLAVVRPRRMNCPPGDVCHVDSPAMRFNRMLFWVSVGIYTGALTVTYAVLWWVRTQS
jgi:hypothetical protein